MNIHDFSLFDNDEYNKIVVDWNRTEKEYPKEKTVVDLFEEQAAKTPDNLAVKYEDVRLSYRELNEAANRLGSYLAREYGIGADDLVCLCLERSELMLLGIWGILKAGGAYVPIQPDYPAERIGYVLRDTGAKVVLTNKKHLQKLQEAVGDSAVKIEVIDDDDFRKKLQKENGTNPNRRAAPENLAYVIYTSGTTGEPKGAMLERRGLLNRVYWMNCQYPLGETDRILQKTPYTFDVSVWELTWALLYGASIMFAKPEGHRDSEYLAELIGKERITVIHFVPSMLSVFEETVSGNKHLIQCCESLRYIFCSGEALALAQVKESHKLFPQTEIHNLYGPTEASIDVLYYDCTDQNIQEVLIGKPIYNTTMYILDEMKTPVPVGAIGELYIGGVGVARGYLNKPELTAEKFAVNPFQSEEEKARDYNGRLYRTGDLARYRNDGNIEYLGRNDFQVKIRGNRIELGEIENAIGGYDGVKQSAVAAREREGNKYLAVYYVGEIAVEKLRKYLEGKLPEYMVPEAYVRLDSLPMTANGKLDRKALPEPEMQDANMYEPPANATETELQKIFAEMLGLEGDKLSVTGDFFRLGGNSITAIKLANRIQRQMNTVVKVADIFANKSVRKLAESAGKGKRERIGKAVFNRVEDQKLSFAQGRLWFIENYEGGSGAYNIPMAARLKEGVNSESLKQAIRDIVRRHEVLRSVIRLDEKDEAYQDVLETELYIEEKKCKNKSEIEKSIKQEARHIFKLSEEIPIRVTLYTTGKDIYISIVIHHIAFDGWSQDIFLKELETLYGYYENGGSGVTTGDSSTTGGVATCGVEYPLAELEIQYKDYAAWQRDQLSGKVLESELQYWKEKLSGYETLNLITDKERPASQQYEGGTVRFSINDQTSGKIKKCAKELGVSVYAVMLGAYYLLLSAYSGQKDIVVGTLSAGREREETAGMIGFFVNTLAMRLELDLQKNAVDYIRGIGEEIAQAQRHGEAPFDRVVEALRAGSDKSRHPIFQASFLLHEEWIGSKSLFAEIGGEQEAAKFDLQLSIAEGETSIRGEMQYAVSLFKKETVECYVNSYIQIVTNIAKEQKKAMKEICLIGKDDYKKIINEWNNTEAEYPHDKTIIDLFEIQAAKTPNNLAVVYEEVRLSYRELNEAANRLGSYLAEKYDIKPDDLIALCLDRSELMLFGIWGVLKSGAAYVPIQPDYPAERIKYILQDTGAKAILTNIKYRQKILDASCENKINIETIDEESFKEKLKNESSENPQRRSAPENLSYVIYTSGTTGEPKGAMLEHRGLLNRVYWMNCQYPLRGTDRVLQKTPYTFDVSVWELTWALLYGASIVFAKPEGHRDSEYLAELIGKERITVIHFVPSMLGVFEETVSGSERLKKHCECLRYIFCSGEALVLAQVKESHKLFPQAAIHNLYGPTEASIDVLYYDCTDQNIQEVLIGRPIYNTTMYILDEVMRPVPLGALGELYIGGVGLARGYMNKPELTAEKFVSNPFQSEAEKARGCNGRLYRTGDLARYRADGNIAYFGRNDFQVKIRGNRIELGEIENAINSFEGIKQNVVLAREREGNKFLAAYYVGSVAVEELRKYLEAHLPEYMVPGAFTQLAELPVTANGKLDRKALPEPDMRDTSEYDPPANETETDLQKIFAEVLGLTHDKVSVTGDFFRMGGDSIRSIQLASRIRRQLGLELTVKDIFAQKTVRNIARRSPDSRTRAAETEQGILKGTSAMLPIQKWFFSKAADGSFKKPGYFNQAFTIETPELDVEVLRASVKKLAQWHDAFRLRYRKDKDGNVEQYYSEETSAAELKLADIDDRNSDEIEIILGAWQSGFDLYGSELYSIGYLSANGKGLIHIAMHHLIVDAVSWRILKDDLQKIYEYLLNKKTEESGGYEKFPAEQILGRKGTSYRQWANRVAQLGQDIGSAIPSEWEGIGEGIRKYREKLRKLDKGVPEQFEVRLNNSQTERLLRGIHEKLGTEANDVLLGAAMAALGELSGETENYVTLEGHGRDGTGEEGIELDRTVGWFTTMYPVRVDTAGLAEMVIRTKEALRELRGKGLLYGAVYGYEGSLPDIVYNYLGQFDAGADEPAKADRWVFSRAGAGKTISGKNSDGNLLTMNGGILGGELVFTITGRFGRHALKKFAETFRKNVLALIAILGSSGRRYLTPSDVHWAISREHLDRLQAEREIAFVFPANSLQEGFIYHHLSAGSDDDSYIVQNVWNYRCALEVNRMREAWELAVKKHPALRLRFDWENELVQIIDREAKPDWRYCDISAEMGQSEYLEWLKAADRQERYDLSKGKLFRVYLIKRSDNLYTTILSMHHAVGDGWSNPVLGKTVHETYDRLTQGGQPPVIREDRSYPEAQEYLRECAAKTDNYWDQYMGKLEEEDLSSLMKQEKCAVQLGEYRRVLEHAEETADISGETYQSMLRFCAGLGITMNTLIQYAWHKQLKVYGNGSMTVTGMTVSGRDIPVEGIEDSVGLFINTLPVIYEHDSNGKVTDELRVLQEIINEVTGRSWKRLGGLTKGDRRIFNSLFVYENYPVADWMSATLAIEYVQAVEKLDYPLGIIISDHDGSLAINIKYAGELFEREKIHALLEGMKHTIEQAVSDTELKTNELKFVCGDEYNRIIFDWNRTEKEYPHDKTIVDLFEEQVAKTPDSTAVVYENVRLSYRELNEAANCIAHYMIKEYSIGADDIVALCLDRSELMVQAILGVLKTGGAYVPIMPEYPVERIEYILRDTGTRAVLTNGKHKQKLIDTIGDNKIKIETIDDDLFAEALKTKSAANPNRRTAPENLAYVIYTSGTTGEPKGVMIEHRSAVNLLSSLYKSYHFVPGREVMFFSANYVFDASVEQIFFPLLNGDVLLVGKTAFWQEDGFIEKLRTEKVTYIHMTPSLLQAIPVETIQSLRRVNSGGEALPEELRKRLCGKHFSFVNSYGPTETTVTSAINTEEKTPHIGRPIANTTCYILSENMQPVPVGAAGELHIGGAGLARGYLNKPELTAEKFVPNPFQSEEEKERGCNGRLYKTGDLARYLHDGNIEYLGRNDSQVKIRGFRIELGEIESTINGYEGVRQSAVLARERGGAKYLAAYYVGELTADKLREYLEGKLPEYMVPEAYVRLDSLPMTANGKLDRRALPEPEMRDANEYEPPANATETELQKIFAEMLGFEVDKLSVTGDFFRLGGNSITAIKLANRIQRHLDMEVKVADIFANKSVRKLAESAGKEQRERIGKAVFNRVEDQRLSFAQGRLWFIESFEGGSGAYNIPMAVRLKEGVSSASVKKAVQEIIRRHEVLRSLIRTDGDGEAYQEVLETALEIAEEQYESKEAAEAAIKEEARHIFKLDQEIPLRAKLYTAGNDTYLSVIVHHIAFDGWSQDIFLKELETLYRYYENGGSGATTGGAMGGGEYPLAELEIQYKDYAAWQRDQLSGKVLESELQYWKEKLSGYETLNLITDKERPASQQYEGGTVRFSFNDQTSEKIKKCAKELGVSVYTVLLGGYYLLLSAYSGQKDIVVGTLSAGREREETAGMIGFFVNTLAMRLELDAQKNAADYIKGIGEEIAQAQRHGEAPFDRVVEALAAETDQSRHPIFQAAFALQEEWTGAETLFEQTGAALQEAAKFDLTLSISEGDKDIKGAITYAVSLFEQDTMERYAQSYMQIVTGLAEGNEKKISEISLIGEVEHEKIINEWNNTEQVYPRDKTAVDLFEEQAAKRPDSTAAVYENVRLSYRELNESANRMAHYLVTEYSIKPDDIVALCLDRSELMLVSILGVLKAGGAYVPILPDYPTERIEYMLSDTGAKAVLTNVKHKQKLIDTIGDNKINIETIDDDTFAETIKTMSAVNPVRRAAPENLAYVIYTSGTTGKPKGAMLEHGGLVNLLAQEAKVFELEENVKQKRCSWYANYVFDCHVWEVFPVLCYGHSLYILADEQRMDLQVLGDYIKKNKINIGTIPPALLDRENILSLEKIVVAGEVCSRELMDSYAEQGVQVINAYGPTECTVVSNLHYFKKGDSNKNIGRVIANTTCYILGENMQPVPVGGVGELHIGGAGLARGYLNRPELTAEKFVPNPFQSEEEKLRGYNARIYKTGDLARYLKDGYVEYLGRNDFQVKIRGFRIELGEIESAINGHEGIKQNAVIARERDGAKYLTVYYVGEADTETLIQYLKERLPEYMVPAVYVRLDSLPMTANGKLDRHALPEPEIQDAKEYEPPVNETEKEMQKIFAEVLGLTQEKVSVSGDFFRMGGDSIKSIQLASRIRRQLGLELTVKDIFAQKTVRNLARRQLGSRVRAAETEQGMLSGIVPMLPVQKWFFSKAADGSFKKPGHFNQAFTIETPELDIELLKISIKKLAQWHDAFRLRYRKDKDGSIEQYYAEETAAPELKLADIDGKNNNEIESILSEWQSGFDLYGNELYSTGYLSAKGKGLIHIAMHHLIVDAVSWRILKDDLQRVYECLQKTEGNPEKIPVEEILGKKGTSYRQWAWIVERFGREAPEKEREYWAGITTGIQKYQEKLLSLDTGKWERVELRLDRNTTDRLLRDIHDSLGTEANDIVLAAVMVALGELTGEAEQYVTVESHGRDGEESADLSRTAGWFTAMHPVRVCAETDLRRTVIMTKEALRETRGKGLLFGSLYGYEKNLPGVVYNYLGQFETRTDAASRDWAFGHGAGKAVSEENDEGNILSMNGAVIGGELAFGISGRLSRPCLERFADTVRKTLEALIAQLGSGGRRYLTPSDTLWAVAREQLERIQRDREVAAVYPANSLQEGFIFHQLRNNARAEDVIDDSYIVQSVWNYVCEIDPEQLKEAWELAVKQYPALRLRFDWEGELVQIIDSEAELDLRYYNITEEADQDGYIERLRAEDRQERYDLSKGKLFRVHLVKRSDALYTSIFSMHHAIGDGWSGPVLGKTVHESYEILMRTGRCPVIREDRSYPEAQVYIRDQKNIDDIYWNNAIGKLEGGEDLSSLLKEGKRNVRLGEYRQILESAEETAEISGGAYRSLLKYNAEVGITMNTLIQYAWHKQLKVYGNGSVTVTGMTVSGRDIPVEGIEDSVGLFINTLPVVYEHGGGGKVTDELRVLQEIVNEVTGRSWKRLGGLTKGDRRIFNSLFVYENYPAAEGTAGHLKIEFVQGEEKLDYPLGVIISDRDGSLVINIKYAGELFEREKIQSLLNGMKHTIEQAVSDTELKSNELTFVCADEYNRIIFDWNRTEKEYPHDKTIVDLFEEQAAKTPDNIAVVYEDKKLSYRELNENANRLGLYLAKEYGIKPDDFVVLCLDRSEIMLTSILGVLKAGAAYVPILPEYPAERIKYMLKDTGTKAVLTNVKHKQKLLEAIGDNRIKIETIDDDTFEEKLKALSAANPVRKAAPENLTHIIYTSGTTGEPKGVMIEHRGLTNHLCWMNSEYPLRETDRVLQKTTYIFDVSAWDLLWAILHGAGVVFAAPGGHLDSVYLTDVIEREQITVIQFVPSMLAVFEETVGSMPDLAKRCRSLRYIFCAGEALALTYVREGQRLFPNAQIHNLYGPSETTIAITNYPCHDPQIDEVLIGRPIGNCTCYILDEQMRPVPEGAVGELYLGGVQLARGYLNKPELTAEKFIPNPFQSEEEKARDYNGRLYRTGDLARYRNDGNIEYLGRNDFQVKIRGNRIELGEIENAINRYEGIKQNTVLAREREGNKYLAAYYVGEADTEALIKYLKDRLPEYMVPGAFMQLSELPLTANGKLDRRALPEPDMQDSNEYDPPVNETETELQKIFAQALGLTQEKVSVTGDFFRLGGNSITAIKLANRIQRQMNMVVKVADIFANKSVRKLAESAVKGKRERIGKAVFNCVEDQKLSYAQGRLWFIENYEGGSNVYNIPMAARLKEGVNRESLKQAIRDIVRRHEVLRSVIRLDEKDEAYQDVLETELHIEEKKCKNKSEIEKSIKQEARYIFKLGEEIPIRVTLYTTGKDIYISIVIHHIAFDGWSQDIFLKELETLYGYYENGATCGVDYPLAELEIQYKDYAAWQREYLQGDVLDRQLTYWKKKLAGYETLNLFTDKERPSRISYAGKEIPFEFTVDTIEMIRQLAKKMEVSVYTVMLSAYYLLLSVYSGQKDIVVGTVNANRENEEISGTIGFFVNTIAMRQEVDTEGDVFALIKSVGESAREAQLHQDIPFEMLVNALGINSSLDRHPIFQTMFVFQTPDESLIETSRAVFDHFTDDSNSSGYETAKFDLTLSIIDDGKTISGNLNYALSLFEMETIESYIETYKEIINQIVISGETNEIES